MSETIYLDNAATTFPKPECVYQALDTANRTAAFNAGRGAYHASSSAASLIEACRKQVMLLAGGTSPEQVIFSPSATIALNQIIGGLELDSYKTVYVSPYEHNAVIRPLYNTCDKLGKKFSLLPVTSFGMIDIPKVEIMFAASPPAAVFLTHISNVTGYILPVAEISAIAHQYDANVIVDCSQSMGLLPATFDSLGADYIVFAGHKTLYASFGIGGYVARHCNALVPFLQGGTGSDSLNMNMPTSSPARYEPSSPNVVSIAGLNAALEWRSNVDNTLFLQQERYLTDYLIDGLKSQSRIMLYLTAAQQNHISIVSFNHKDYHADELGTILDQDFAISVRAGYHCAPLIHDLLDSKSKRGTVRASISHFTTKSDIDALLGALLEIN